VWPWGVAWVTAGVVCAVAVLSTGMAKRRRDRGDTEAEPAESTPLFAWSEPSWFGYIFGIIAMTPLGYLQGVTLAGLTIGQVVAASIFFAAAVALTIVLDRTALRVSGRPWRGLGVVVTGLISVIPLRTAYDYAFALGLGVPTDAVRLPLSVVVAAAWRPWLQALVYVVVAAAFWYIFARRFVPSIGFLFAALIALGVVSPLAASLGAAQAAGETLVEKGELTAEFRGAATCGRVERSSDPDFPPGYYWAMWSNGRPGVIIGPLGVSSPSTIASVWWGSGLPDRWQATVRDEGSSATPCD
jgi:hypothetical protein